MSPWGFLVLTLLGQCSGRGLPTRPEPLACVPGAGQCGAAASVSWDNPAPPLGEFSLDPHLCSGRAAGRGAPTSRNFAEGRGQGCTRARGRPAQGRWALQKRCRGPHAWRWMLGSCRCQRGENSRSSETRWGGVGGKPNTQITPSLRRGHALEPRAKEGPEARGRGCARADLGVREAGI